MIARASLLIAGIAATALLPACQRTEPAETAPAPQVENAPAAADPVAAPAEAMDTPAEAAAAPAEPGRTVCGAVSLVLPEGASVSVRDADAGGFPGASIALADGVTMEVAVIGDTATVVSPDDDTALQAPLQLWLDGIGPRMADEWTAEISALESDGVRGYYAVAKSELSGQPGKAFAINGFYAIDGHIVSIGAVHDDASGAVNERIIEIVRSAEWAGS